MVEKWKKKTKLWNRGLPILAKVWTSNSLLSLWLALSMRMTNPGLIRSWGHRGVFYFQKASRTTEMVTVRQLFHFILNENELLFWTKTLQRGFFSPKGRMLLSLCYFSWFRPSQHSHGNGNIGYPVHIDDANFGRLLVGSLFFLLFTHNISTSHLVLFSCCTFAIFRCK